MTTAQAMTAPPARMTDDEPRARFRDLLAAEWLKTWSLRSTSWMYAITALAVIGFNAGTAYDHYKYWYQYDDRGRATFIANGSPLMDAFTGNAAMVLVLAVAAIGAVSITGEYGTGLIRTTFTAVPARRSVMAAKALVLTAVTTLFGALVALASFVSTQAILSGRDASVTLGHPGALRLVVASALLAPVAALAGLAIGAVIRHTGGAVIGCVVVLLLLPMVLSDHAASHGGAPARCPSVRGSGCRPRISMRPCSTRGRSPEPGRSMSPGPCWRVWSRRWRCTAGTSDLLPNSTTLQCFSETCWKFLRHLLTCSPP